MSKVYYCSILEFSVLVQYQNEYWVSMSIMFWASLICKCVFKRSRNFIHVVYIYIFKFYLIFKDTINILFKYVLRYCYI